jgi:hypothetical protein
MDIYSCILSIHPQGMGIINALDTIAYVIGLLLGFPGAVSVSGLCT